MFSSCNLLNHTARLWILSGAALLVSACANPYHISKSEIAAYNDYANCNKVIYEDCRIIKVYSDGNEKKASNKTISNIIAYADDLSESYLNTAGIASGSQDLLAIGVIGAAATVAGGTIFDANKDLIRSAVLGAATASELGRYFEPGKTVDHLVNASERVACISLVGKRANGSMMTALQKKSKEYKHKLGDSGEVLALRAALASLGIDIVATELSIVDLIDSYIRRAKIDLRKILKRDTPNYDSILEKLKAAAKEKENDSKNVSRLNSFIKNPQYNGDQLYELVKSELIKCEEIII